MKKPRPPNPSATKLMDMIIEVIRSLNQIILNNRSLIMLALDIARITIYVKSDAIK